MIGESRWFIVKRQKILETGNLTDDFTTKVPINFALNVLAANMFIRFKRIKS